MPVFPKVEFFKLVLLNLNISVEQFSQYEEVGDNRNYLNSNSSSLTNLNNRNKFYHQPSGFNRSFQENLMSYLFFYFLLQLQLLENNCSF